MNEKYHKYQKYKNSEMPKHHKLTTNTQIIHAIHKCQSKTKYTNTRILQNTP